MGKIRPYESQVSSQGDLPARSAQLQDFGGPGVENLGKAVQSLGSDAGQIQRFMLENQSRREVTDAQTSLTQLSTDLTMELDKRARDWKPGDPYLSDVVPGMLKERLDGLRYAEDGGEKYATTAGAGTFQRQAEKLVQHFTTTAMQVDGQLAGKAAVIQFNQTVDAAGNLLQNRGAPLFPLKRDEIHSLIMNPHGEYGRIGYLEQEKLARMADERLAISAVQGFIRQRPNAALEKLQDPMLAQDETYGWIAKYIPAEKLAPLINSAETAVAAQEAEAARAEAAANRLRIAGARAAEATILEKIGAHMDDPANNPMPTGMEIVESPLIKDGLDPDKGKSLIQLIHSWSREDPNRPTHTDPTTMRELVRRIHLPDGDERKLTDNTAIYQAYDKGLLSFTDMKNLNTEFNDARTPEGQRLGQTKDKFIRGMSQMIDHSNPLMGRIDRSGPANVYAFEHMVNSKIEEYRKAGKDVYSLFDPAAPDYLGKPERVRPFEKPMMDSIRDFSDKLQQAPGAPKAPSGGTQENYKRQPGETIEKWLERTQGGPRS